MSPLSFESVRHLGVSAALTALTSLALSAPARAQQPPSTQEERVQTLYVSAVKLYNEGRNREAIAKFDEVIALDARPVFHCNRAAVLLKVNELDRAIEDLTICRDDYDADAAQLASIDAQLSAVTLVKRGVLKQSRSLAAQLAYPVIAAPPVVPPLQVPPPPPEESAWRPVGYVALAAGAALVASAGALDLLSGELRDDFEDASSSGTSASRDDYDALRSKLARRRVAFYALGASGLTLSTVGVGALILGRTRRDRSSDASALTISPSPAGATLRWKLRF